MKFTAAALSATLLVAASSIESTQAFVPASSKLSTTTGFVANSNSRLPPAFASPRSSRLAMSAASAKTDPLTVGIIGATGAVGKEIRQCLQKRKFPVAKLRIFGSERSAGKDMDGITVELFDVEKARQCDVVFMAVSGGFSLEHAKAMSDGESGCVVIDNSSAFRYDPDVPLCVPEINGKKTSGKKLIANPNCTTAIGLMALWPLHKAFGLKRIIMSTYQAASGAGQPGMDELKEGTKQLLDDPNAKINNKIFAHPLPFNVIPHIDKFLENGYTKEEMKVVWESRKICDLPDDFPVSCTAVRIPTFRAHAESIIVETEKPVDLDVARKVLHEATGIALMDDPEALQYPMPMAVTGQDDVQVGRLRKSLIFGDHGLELFVCGDQLLRGAALNAVLVAEEMVNNGSLKASEERQLVAA